MLMSTANQAYVFLCMVYTGIIMGFLYDINRIIRAVIHANKIATGILDLIYWVVVCILAFAVIYITNDGEIRMYTFFGFIIGGILYTLALSPFVMGIFKFFNRKATKIKNSIKHNKNGTQGRLNVFLKKFILLIARIIEPEKFKSS